MQKEVYIGAIPGWAWIVFAIVAFDDILLWFKSPMMALPVTLVLVIVILVLFIGGRGMFTSILNNAIFGAPLLAIFEIAEDFYSDA